MRFISSLVLCVLLGIGLCVGGIYNAQGSSTPQSDVDSDSTLVPSPLNPYLAALINNPNSPDVIAAYIEEFELTASDSDLEGGSNLGQYFTDGLAGEQKVWKTFSIASNRAGATVKVMVQICRDAAGNIVGGKPLIQPIINGTLDVDLDVSIDHNGNLHVQVTQRIDIIIWTIPNSFSVKNPPLCPDA